MGRAGFVRGSVYAQNSQAGSISKTLGGTGTDTVAVTFKKAFEKVPAVVVSNTSDVAVTSLRVLSKTKVGFTLKIITSSLTAATTFDYHAYDDTYN